MTKQTVYILLFLTLSGFCDSMSIVAVPDIRTARPMFTTDVEMVAESVLIVPEGHRINGFPLMRVSCVFYLKNLTDDTLSVDAGFPFETFDFSYNRRYDSYSIKLEQMLEFVHSDESPESRVPAWLDFRVSTDRGKIPFVYLKGMPSEEDRFLYYPLIAAWNMEFEPGQTIRLENSYCTGWNHIGYRFWRSNELRYVLLSGSTWQGPIGDAVIHLEVPAEFPLPYAGPDIGAYWDWSGSPTVESRSVTWHYTDWEPTEDIVFRTISASYALIPEFEVVFDPFVIEWDKEKLINSMKVDLGFRSVYPPLNVEYMLSMAAIANYSLSGLDLHDPAIEPAGKYFFKVRWTIFFDDGQEEYDPARLEMVSELHTELAETRDAVLDRYFRVLFPYLCVKRTWSESNLAKFAANPDLQQRYLLMLENLEPALDGDSLSDPRMSDLYRITGWYAEGYPMNTNTDSFYSQIIGIGEFTLEREKVRDFWLSGGGCNVPLIPAFHDTNSDRAYIPAIFSASSGLVSLEQIFFSSENLQDNDPATPWLEAEEGYGYEETVLIKVGGNRLVSGFELLNGYTRDDETWVSNGRAAKLIVYLNGAPVCVAELIDDPSLQTVNFSEPLVVSEKDIVSFSILEVYPGTISDHTAISELHLF